MKITAKELRALIASVAISSYKRKRLGNCEAWIVDCPDKGIKVLMSYATFVAYYDVETHTVVVFDSYSATTTQHVWKFIKTMNHEYVVTLIQFPYERKDHLIHIYDYYITGNKHCDYLKMSKEDMPYANKSVRDEVSRAYRKRMAEEGYASFLRVPSKLVDEYVEIAYNGESYESFVNRYYIYTVW